MTARPLHEVVELAKAVQTAVPAKPSLVGKVDTFQFRTRIDFANPTVAERFQAAFFRDRRLPPISSNVRPVSTDRTARGASAFHCEFAH